MAYCDPNTVTTVVYDEKDCPAECEYICEDIACELGNSVYRTDYNKKDFSKAKVLRPQSNLGLVDDPFAKTTIYRNEYNEKTPCPNRVKRVNTYKMNETPFDHESVYKKDFTQKNAEKSKPFSSQGNIGFADDPFANKTVYRDEYVNAFGERPRVKIPMDNLKQQGNFDSTTNYRTNYVKHNGKKQDYMIPEDNLHPEGNYSHNTLYRSDYTPKLNAEKRNLLIAKDNLKTGCNGLFGKRCYCICPKNLKTRTPRDKLTNGQTKKPASYPEVNCEIERKPEKEVPCNCKESNKAQQFEKVQNTSIPPQVIYDSETKRFNPCNVTYSSDKHENVHEPATSKFNPCNYNGYKHENEVVCEPEKNPCSPKDDRKNFDMRKTQNDIAREQNSAFNELKCESETGQYKDPCEYKEKNRITLNGKRAKKIQVNPISQQSLKCLTDVAREYDVPCNCKENTTFNSSTRPHYNPNIMETKINNCRERINKINC